MLALVPFRPCRSTRASAPRLLAVLLLLALEVVFAAGWPGPSIRSRGLMTTLPCWPTAATREHRIPGSGLTRARVHREPCLHQQYQWVLDRDIRALPTQRPPSPPPPSSTRIRAARASIRWATSADSRIRLWNAPPLGRSFLASERTSEFARPPQNGHYLALDISAQTFPPLKDLFGSGQFYFSAHNWKLIVANGTTYNGSLSSGPALGCLADSEKLPDRVGTREKVTGTLILDVPATEGTLVFAPTFADASWEWQHPAP